MDDIEINPKQPVHDFDKQSLDELAESIKLHDIIQPITVSLSGKQIPVGLPVNADGEPANKAGLKDIPAYIRQSKRYRTAGTGLAGKPATGKSQSHRNRTWLQTPDGRTGLHTGTSG